jgi:DNA-binding NarL/FixJ family response regulator
LAGDRKPILNFGKKASFVYYLPGFSTRELEIASLVARGMTSKEIGTRLTISAKTVEVPCLS